MTNKEWLDDMTTGEMLELFDMLFYEIDSRCSGAWECASQDVHWKAFAPAFTNNFEPIYAQSLANRRGLEWDDEPAMILRGEPR